MRIFLSHVSDEAAEARALKNVLESAIPGCDVFVSASDIHIGDSWLREIDEALSDAIAIVALCSPASVRRPWLNFESGSGWTRRLRVIPACHKGLRKDRLPDPMRIFQAVELTLPESLKGLVEELASLCGSKSAADFDPLRIRMETRAEMPLRSTEIGIVVSHQQCKWDGGKQSIFGLAESLPPGLSGEWIFRPLTDERAFLSVDLNSMAGLIFACPWRVKLEPEVVSATVDWVTRGGRLLLLGFELGDRHHGTNLAELSHQFGIDPASDIVGPRQHGASKPYETPVDFETQFGDKHPLTDTLKTIRLANVQTLRVEPGGLEWLRVGENVVYRPRGDTVRYRDGTMTSPGGNAFERNRHAGWLPVAVEAPKDLCGAGGVHMIGTWDLLGRQTPFGSDNVELVPRLLNWLSGETPGVGD
jgi:hypothetical protein